MTKKNAFRISPRNALQYHVSSDIVSTKPQISC